MRFKFEVNEDNTISHHQNRGMDLEDEINKTNEFYRLNDIALVYKRHTPIKVVRCHDKKITEAYFDEPSTTDYYGVYKGKYIDFEAKETSSTTVFPLANLRDNQIRHIKNVIQNGGISFLIVSFTNLEKYFLLSGEKLLTFIKTNERKSIPLEVFLKEGKEIKRGLNPPLDYIKLI